MPSPNIDLIRGVYRDFAAGNVEGVLACLSPDIVWKEANNFPYADRSPYIGPQAVLEGVFARCAAEWDGFSVDIEEFLDAGDAIVALGHYRGTFKATGRAQETQIAHVWRIRDGKVVAFQQHADTLHVARVTGAC
jgi:ketosteroid isomerase-like protein